MKSTLLVFIFLTLCIMTYGQGTSGDVTGKITYISSQNVYVKFETTEGIHIGDTLYVIKNEKKIPAIVVSNLSSISCVGSPVSTESLSVSTPILARKKITENKPIEVIAEKSKESVSVNDQAIKASGNNSKTDELKTRFDGRLSVSSYSNVSSYSSNQRFRYNLALNAEHIGNSKLSAESYISFTHMLSFPSKTTDWTGLNNALKIYSLAAKYDLSKTASISFGRKIYNNMANIGAVDGLEFEKVSRNFTYGALVGSRPDYSDYSFNPNLLQYGAFVSHNLQKENGNIQTSAAVFNQMNNFKTDRRFTYFQHSNSLLKNLDLFCSFEFDLYAVKDSIPKNTFDLTSTYISLRYKPWKNVSMSLAYDARKNIYYYETFAKNKIDSTLDKETRQGFRFQTMYRPFRNLIWGGNVGYRLASQQKSDTLPTSSSINGYTYLTYTQVPLIDASVTISATALKSMYMKSMTVYGISLSRDFFSGNVNVEAEYRLGSYLYSNITTSVQQNIAAMSIFWRIAKRLTLSANFEATLEKNNNSGLVFLNISQRF